MRKVYRKPTIVFEKFQANEYIAACGDSGTIYKFTCNAGDGASGSVYEETNGVTGFQNESKGHLEEGFLGIPTWVVDIPADEFRSNYHACGKTHEASSNSGFIDGYYVVNDTVTPVIIWTENGTNTHCTTNLDMDSWETAKS